MDIVGLGFLFNIAKVAIGLGLVIFLHELGHFLLAKWNGVKVEKFSVGFGPPLLSYTYGETEYALSAIPLGGFVKMLGEGPDGNQDAAADPRSYNNKSVGARMAIISAGVIMNLILGLICFIIVYSQGTPLIPAVIGTVVPDRPAYEKGLKVGDEIVAIDGRPNVDFVDLRLAVSLSGANDALKFEIRRPGQSEPFTVPIHPRRDETATNPSIGILPARDLILWLEMPFLPPAGMEGRPEGPNGGFRGHDRLLSVTAPGGEPKPITTELDLIRALVAHRDKPLTFEVERNTKVPNLPETPLPAEPNESSASEQGKASVTVPPNAYVDFGFVMGIEPIVSLREDGPAARAGFKVGDRITKVDGQEDFDPLRIPDLASRATAERRALKFEVRRKDGASTTIEVTPDDTPLLIDSLATDILPMPLDVPSLGLAYNIGTTVRSVREGSPAARAGVKPGDVLVSVNVPVTADAEGKSEAVTPIPFTESSLAWPAAFGLIQTQPHRSFPLIFRPAASKRTVVRWLEPEPVKDWFNPYRGLQLRPLTRELPPQGMIAAIALGVDDTVRNIKGIYQTIRGLFQERISRKLIGGPITIARMGYRTADAGWIPLIQFLGMLSINLAVLNFLPIPPLDGGQMLFLIAEKVRGRPLPDSAQAAGIYAGLALVLLLMAFVIFQDVVSLF